MGFSNYWTPKIQDGGDPPSWILMPKCQKMRFSQKLSNLELWSLLQKNGRKNQNYIIYVT